MFQTPPPNLAEVEKIKQAGMNARHRSILEEIGYQILSNSMSLGVEAFKYHQLGGAEKTKADMEASAADTATAGAAMMDARSRAKYAQSSEDLYNIAQAGMVDPETRALKPGYNLRTGPQGTQLTTSPAAAAPSQADWVYDKDLKNPNGTTGGMRPRTQSEWESYNRSKLARRGTPEAAVAARQDAKTKAGLEADIQRIRAAIANITDPADPRLPGLRAELKTQQGAAAWYESRYKVRGAWGEAGLKPKKKVKEKTLQQNLKALYPPAVYAAYSKSKDIQSVVFDATSRLGGELAKGKTIEFEGRRYPAMEFIDDLRNLPIDRQKERLERIAAEAVKGNADCQAIWNEIALSLTGEE